MIYLNNILITEDILFEKKRSTHELFKQKREVVGKGYRDTGKVYNYFAIFQKGLSIDFKAPITIIVGDNGTGKTSLLRMFKYKAFQKSWNDDTPEKIEKSMNEHMDKYIRGRGRTLTFSGNPSSILFLEGLHKSVIGGELQKDVKKSEWEGNMPERVSRMFFFEEISNGEALLDLYDELKGVKNTLVILDEPETSMSLKSVAKLCVMLKTLVDNGNQLIISTHHPYFMKLVDEVYDIEKKKYVATDKYLKSFEHGG